MPRLPFRQLITKATTRESDAIAAARRRLPMTELPGEITVVGAAGPIPFLDAFEGRRRLIGYFHMWHDGKPWDQQCEGCTFFTAQTQRPAYLCTVDRRSGKTHPKDGRTT